MSLLFIQSNSLTFSSPHSYSLASSVVHIFVYVSNTTLSHFHSCGLFGALSPVYRATQSSWALIVRLVWGSIPRDPGHSYYMHNTIHHSLLSAYPICHPLSPAVFHSLTPLSTLPCLSLHFRHITLSIWSGGASSLKGTEVLVGGFAWSCAVAY